MTSKLPFEPSRESGKPLLVLFDEVPGCSTVLGFGEGALSDGEVVERITRDFIPVAVFNNIGGADAKVLASFNEPTWNNPIVRVMDANRKELVPRFDGPYTKDAFVKVLSAAVKARLETATLAASCFWECEAKLGTLEAVRASRVGFLEGEEVVEVQFDPAVSSRADFLRDAQRLDCAPRVFTRNDEEQRASLAAKVNAVQTKQSMRYSEKDTKYFLKGRSASTSGLTEQELVRRNAKSR